jgi:gliding motility-associated-like protein
MKGSIFDRWGNLVYGSEAPSFSWNGFFNEEPVMPGVYAYVIQFDYVFDGNTRQEVLYGDVTVVR